MTSTPHDAPPTPPVGGPRVTREQLRDLDRLQRTTGSQKYVAGVAGGVARHLDIDPAIVRVLFVVLTFFGGAGLMLYGALWLLLPEDDGDQAMINLDKRSLGFVLGAVVVVAALLLVGDSWGGFGFPWPLTIAGIVVAVVLLTRDRRASTPSVAPPPYAGAAVPAYAPVPETDDEATGETPHTYPYPDVTATYPAGPSGGAPWTPPVRTPRPRDPRRRGPLLFWFTLALIALAVGILGMVHVSGVDVPGSAYPALALGITGLMLVIGAFFGRAGGLILLGLLIAPGLAVATVVENYEDDTVVETPLTADAVQPRYELGAGELTLDLTQVSDLEALDGRLITVDGGIGRLEIIVPNDVDVLASASVGGPGDVSVFGDHADGIDRNMTRTQDARDEVASIRLDAELGVGEIVITTERGVFR